MTDPGTGDRLYPSPPGTGDDPIHHVVFLHGLGEDPWQVGGPGTAPLDCWRPLLEAPLDPRCWTVGGHCWRRRWPRRAPASPRPTHHSLHSSCCHGGRAARRRRTRLRRTRQCPTQPRANPVPAHPAKMASIRRSAARQGPHPQKSSQRCHCRPCPCPCPCRRRSPAGRTSQRDHPSHCERGLCRRHWALRGLSPPWPRDGAH